MNVLLVVPWDQQFGGVASVVGNLAQWLRTSGDDVIFLHPGSRTRLQPKNTAWGFPGYEVNLRGPFNRTRPVRSIVAFSVFFLFTLYQLTRVIHSHRIQIVNIHYPLEEFLYFGVLRWVLPIKLVVSVHGADLFEDGERLRKYPWSLRFLLFSSDVVVAPSRAFLEDCLSSFPGMVNKATYIHNGINIDEFARAGHAVDLVSGQRYVLCIAAHNRKKAVDVLLRAFARVSEVHRDIRLVLVGDGPLRREHEELATSLLVRDRVEFLGWRGRLEISRLLRGCAIFVLPSRSEPFGLVVAEALACRKPVVASAVGGIPEIIEDGRSGILVEPDQPVILACELLALLENESLPESLGRAGYQRVIECFSCETMGARYQGLYSALVRGVRRETE